MLQMFSLFGNVWQECLDGRMEAFGKVKCPIFILKLNGRVPAYEIQLDSTLQAAQDANKAKMGLRGV